MGLPLTDEIDVSGASGDRVSVFRGKAIYLRRFTGEFHLVVNTAIEHSPLPAPGGNVPELLVRPPLVVMAGKVMLDLSGKPDVIPLNPNPPVTPPVDPLNPFAFSAGVVTLSVPSSGASSGGSIVNNTPTDTDTAAEILKNLVKTLIEFNAPFDGWL
jgi:hypothetical protein